MAGSEELIKKVSFCIERSIFLTEWEVGFLNEIKTRLDKGVKASKYIKYKVEEIFEKVG